MKSIKIAIFDEWWPVRYEHTHPRPKLDEPTQWARFMDVPRFTEFWEGPDGRKWCEVRDDRVLDELQRLITFKTCPICRTHMHLRDTGIEGEEIYICLSCGYWGGIGFREWNFHDHLHPMRGAIGRYTPIIPIDNQQTEYLITHLRRSPKDLTKISPKRAEKFVVDLLSDYLDCEVRVLGGVKDGGIDGFILKGDRMSCIIQVKWRESAVGAEGVKVVREVAGTLIARGVPSGILVSNRIRYSDDARREAKEISKREITGLGQLSLSLMNYQDVIDMLELSATKLTADMTIKDWFKIRGDICVFDGAAKISEELVKKFL